MEKDFPDDWPIFDPTGYELIYGRRGGKNETLERLAEKYSAEDRLIRPHLKEKKMVRLSDKILSENKFYVGSHSIFQDRRWGHATIEEAIEHASSLAEEQKSDQFVVQIVKVVRRQKPPLVVEDVK